MLVVLDELFHRVRVTAHNRATHTHRLQQAPARYEGIGQVEMGAGDAEQAQQVGVGDAANEVDSAEVEPAVEPAVDQQLVDTAGVHGNALEQTFVLYNKNVLKSASARDLKDVNAALKAEAAKKGMSFSAYAATLLEVAWAARHGQSGDFELDRTVAGTLLLAGSGLDLDAIGATLGVSEDLVDKIVGAFKQEVGHA